MHGSSLPTFSHFLKLKSGITYAFFASFIVSFLPIGNLLEAGLLFLFTPMCEFYLFIFWRLGIKFLSDSLAFEQQWRLGASSTWNRQ